MRKTKDIFISDGSRDNGKCFRITEMPADQGEWWALRVGGLVLEADKNHELLGVAMSGMSTLAELGILLITKFALSADPAKLKPLLEEMEQCWSVVDPKNPKIALPFTKDCVEETSTFLKLRAETMELHFSFFLKLGTQNSTD